MFLKIFSFIIFVHGIHGEVFDYQPQQVHIAYGENVDQMVITWSTIDPTEQSLVSYSSNGVYSVAEGESKVFVDGGREKRKQYIHKVTLKDLQPGKRYLYRCGSPLGWSDEFWFDSQPADQTNWSPKLAIFGDMGNENAQSLARLQDESHQKYYDAIIHVGDFAYDMDSENALVGDQFMRQIESIAAYVPYMVCAGNHEEKYNFSNYRARFNMPSESQNLYYSFNMGPVHFIGFDTELYYFLNYGLKPLANQYEWLKNDLREANKPENRKLRPWIVTFGHRPMYCSNNNHKDCRRFGTLVRVGLPITHLYGLEDLFMDNGVDVAIWAHQHSYERLYPIYNYNVRNGSYEEPYRNARAPVHITTGSAGCKEGHATFIKNPPEWSAFRSDDYGYTRMRAFNTTHLYFEQVSDDKNGEVIDSFWIVKDRILPAYANLEAIFQD